MRSASRVAAVGLALLVLTCAPGRADATPITGDGAAFLISISAETCQTCFEDMMFPDVNIDAQFRLQPVTGSFYDPVINDYREGRFLQVLSIRGHMNGIPDLALALAPNGAASWVLPGDYRPGFLHLSAGGFPFRLIDDSGLTLLSDGRQTIPLRWTAARVPDETASLLLLAIALTGLFVTRKFARPATRTR